MSKENLRKRMESIEAERLATAGANFARDMQKVQELNAKVREKVGQLILRGTPNLTLELLKPIGVFRELLSNKSVTKREYSGHSESGYVSMGCRSFVLSGKTKGWFLHDPKPSDPGHNFDPDSKTRMGAYDPLSYVLSQDGRLWGDVIPAQGQYKTFGLVLGSYLVEEGTRYKDKGDGLNGTPIEQLFPDNPSRSLSVIIPNPDSLMAAIDLLIPPNSRR